MCGTDSLWPATPTRGYSRTRHGCSRLQVSNVQQQYKVNVVVQLAAVLRLCPQLPKRPHNSIVVLQQNSKARGGKRSAGKGGCTGWVRLVCRRNGCVAGWLGRQGMDEQDG